MTSTLIEERLAILKRYQPKSADSQGMHSDPRKINFDLYLDILHILTAAIVTGLILLIILGFADMASWNESIPLALLSLATSISFLENRLRKRIVSHIRFIKNFKPSMPEEQGRKINQELRQLQQFNLLKIIGVGACFVLMAVAIYSQFSLDMYYWQQLPYPIMSLLVGFSVYKWWVSSRIKNNLQYFENGLVG